MPVRHIGSGFPRLSDGQREELEIPPTREEIKKEVWSCESSKAPGYDGFNLGFIKKMWDIVGEEFIMMILNFFAGGTLPKAVNTT